MFSALKKGPLSGSYKAEVPFIPHLMQSCRLSQISDPPSQPHGVISHVFSSPVQFFTLQRSFVKVFHDQLVPHYLFVLFCSKPYVLKASQSMTHTSCAEISIISLIRVGEGTLESGDEESKLLTVEMKLTSIDNEDSYCPPESAVTEIFISILCLYKGQGLLSTQEHHSVAKRVSPGGYRDSRVIIMSSGDNQKACGRRQFLRFFAIASLLLYWSHISTFCFCRPI